MDDYPIFDDDGEEELSFPNMWRAELPQTMEGSECFIPDAPIYPDENWVVLKLTGDEYLKLFSSIYVGAEFAYPDQYLQILTSFMKGTNCPPIMPEQECFEYPSYAAFALYSPQNPFLEPEEIPDGYLTPPFIQVTEDNIDEFPSYELNDVIVSFGSLTLDVDWLDDISGQLPTIQLHVQGEGDVNIKFLNVVQGGLVIVTLDNPPDILDIIGGIISGGDHILDVNLDSVSLPPETATEIIYSVHTEGAVDHIIYCVFCPIVDDSLLPLRFGGGFRGATLCNFAEQPEMGITAIRYQPTLDPAYRLQYFLNGEWVNTEGWPILEAKFDDIDLAIANHNDRIVNLETFKSDTEDILDNHETRISILEEEVIVVADAADFAQSTADDAYAWAVGADAAAAVADAKAQDALDQNIIQDERLDALELQEEWSHEVDFTTGTNGFSGGVSYSAGNGFIINNSTNDLSNGSVTIRDGKFTHALVQTKRITGTGFFEGHFWFTASLEDMGAITLGDLGLPQFNWVQLRQLGGTSLNLGFSLKYTAAVSLYVQKVTFYGRGENPFA